MAIKRVYFYSFLFILLSSCQKSNINEYNDFIGKWHAVEVDVEYEIEIKSNGRATYEKTTKNTKVYYRGKFIVNENQLKIGFKKLEINKYPYVELSTGMWKVALDNVDYYKH